MSRDDQVQIRGEVIFEDMTSRNVSEKQFVQLLRGEQPNVSNRKLFEASNPSATTVTDFLRGAPGQRIHILGDDNTTIEHGTFIFTNTGANKLLQSNVVYKFTYFPIQGPPRSHKWVEDE